MSSAVAPRTFACNITKCMMCGTRGNDRLPFVVLTRYLKCSFDEIIKWQMFITLNLLPGDFCTSFVGLIYDAFSCNSATPTTDIKQCVYLYIMTPNLT